MGSSMISWFNKKQMSVSLSIVEEDYIIACSTSYEVVWIRKLLTIFLDVELEMTCVYYDSESCVKLSKNPVFHDKSKHIKVKYHYI